MSTQEIRKSEDKANTKNQKIRRRPEVCLQESEELKTGYRQRLMKTLSKVPERLAVKSRARNKASCLQLTRCFVSGLPIFEQHARQLKLSNSTTLHTQKLSKGMSPQPRRQKVKSAANRSYYRSYYIQFDRHRDTSQPGEVNGFYCKASSDKSLAMALEALTLEHQLKELFCEKGLVRGLPHLEFKRMINVRHVRKRSQRQHHIKVKIFLSDGG
ncbi:hypothetical protein AgCh_004631 [Apium graveolens]